MVGSCSRVLQQCSEGVPASPQTELPLDQHIRFNLIKSLTVSSNKGGELWSSGTPQWDDRSFLPLRATTTLSVEAEKFGLASISLFDQPCGK